MTDAFFEKNHVFMEYMGHLNGGKLKIADQSLMFRNSKTSKVETIPVSKVKNCVWMRLAAQPGLKIVLEDGAVYRFGGFNDEKDYEKVKTFLKENWDKELDTVEQSVRGWNYGEVDFNDQELDFQINGKQAFAIPLANVSNCSAAKNEVVMEFHQNDECPISLMEMRFHIPSEAAEGEVDPVEEFKKAVLKYAGVLEDTDRPLVTLDKLLCATPRGRYDFKIFPNHLSLHGSTYDYKIPVKTILRMFLLPHKDGQRMFFVVSLDPPLRQGQTRYPYLVVEFTKDEEVEIEIGLSEQQLQDKYDGKLQKEMQGPIYEVLSRIMRILLNQRITVPGSFIGHSGTPAVSCSFKQAAGLLYPLEKGFIYVHKPPMYIRFDDISAVNFARSDVTTKSFDFEVDTKQGGAFQFNGIEKDEYTRLFDFVNKKELRIRNAGKQKAGMPKGPEEWGSSGDEMEHDPYKKKLEAEAKEREEELGEESDSEDEDSDYNPLEDKKKRKEESSGSDSEPDLEYDSDAATPDSEASGSDAESKPKKKHKTVKERAPRKEGGKKKKRQKDENAPKRGKSAYMFWFNAKRESLKEEGMSMTEIAKKAGEVWRTLTDDDKKEYDAMAAEDKERYAREMEEYRKKGPSTPTKSKSGPSSPKKSTPSKKVTSAEYVDTSGSSSDEDDKPLSSAGNKKEEDDDDDGNEEEEEEDAKSGAEGKESSDDSSD